MFKKGDRVRLIKVVPFDEENGLVVGMTGEVLHAGNHEDVIGIWFDDFTGGHNMCSSWESGTYNKNSGWFIDAPRLELYIEPLSN